MTVPVNADFEGGFAVEPQQVAANVKLAADTGIAGLSIEDSSGDAADPLYRVRSGRRRVFAPRGERSTRAARASFSPAAPRVSSCGRPDIDETIRRLRAYAEAGADCLYAPRIDTSSTTSPRSSPRSSPKPVNLLINAPFMTVAEAAHWEYDGSAWAAHSRAPPGMGS